MVFVLDNYDSFTYNLVQYMGELGAEMVVKRNDELTPGRGGGSCTGSHPNLPGPCTPQDAGISIELIRHFAKADKRVPILGYAWDIRRSVRRLGATWFELRS